jgi:hypothetical protein
MTKALLIKPDNTTEDIELGDWRDISKHLDCRLFTVIPNMTGQNFDLLGDDEALLMEPEFIEKNEFGSQYYGDNFIAGRVMAVGKPDFDGEMTDLSDTDASAIKRELESMKEKV